MNQKQDICLFCFAKERRDDGELAWSFFSKGTLPFREKPVVLFFILYYNFGVLGFGLFGARATQLLSRDWSRSINRATPQNLDQSLLALVWWYGSFFLNGVGRDLRTNFSNGSATKVT